MFLFDVTIENTNNVFMIQIQDRIEITGNYFRGTKMLESDKMVSLSNDQCVAVCTIKNSTGQTYSRINIKEGFILYHRVNRIACIKTNNDEKKITTYAIEVYV